MGVILSPTPSLGLAGGTVTGPTTFTGGLSTTQNGQTAVLPGLLATTGAAGFALQNATPTILTWTAPNDGKLHRVQVFGTLFAVTAETGGAVTLNYTDPGGNANSTSLWPAALSGANTATAKQILIGANTAVSVVQQSALSAGGPATVWAELWGS